MAENKNILEICDCIRTDLDITISPNDLIQIAHWIEADRERIVVEIVQVARKQLT